jgi:hypothetical protein
MRAHGGLSALCMLCAPQGLAKQREMDAQRTKMIIKLKEDRIVRLQARPIRRHPTL